MLGDGFRTVRTSARSLCVLVVLMALASGMAVAAPAPGSVADGTIAALDASSLTIATRAGTQVRAVVNADTRIIRRQAAKLEQIQPKDFIGVAAKREPDGTLVAVAINIFPPEFRGRVREGQFPMETGNVMTNAFVFQNVRRVEGRTLYLNFPEGRAVIQVPRDAEINKLTQVRLADLRAGMRVTVRGPAAADGTITAATVTAEDAAR